MRTIRDVHPAESRPIADLKTFSPLPTDALDQVDPFLFLNHHGPQFYPANNNGLPFGPHPHRGMQTITLIIDGDVMHKDSGGHESVITSGGVQWMVAGRGLVHAEVSSPKFKKEGGQLELLQLWVNLPASHKMIAPAYQGLQKEEVPVHTLQEGKVKMKLISGDWGAKKGAFHLIPNVHLATVDFSSGGRLKIEVPTDQNIFFYVIKGNVEVNGRTVSSLHLVEFNNDKKELDIASNEEATILLGYAPPLREPVVAQGPFVMNTTEEIRQAYRDYQEGKFGGADLL